MRTPEGLPPMGLRHDPRAPGRATVNYFAPAATRVTLEFPESGDTVELQDGPYGHWIADLPEPQPGATYGFRVTGPWEPGYGLRLNPAKFLMDPYALAVTGELQVHDAIHSYRMDDPDTPDDVDSAPYVPHSVYTRALGPSENKPPRIPWDRTVIYELHVKGFTKLHPDVPEQLRGTYAGLAHPAVTGYLSDLGITTVELLPVQHFVPEPMLLGRGLTNYWGYNPIAYFAPHAGYAAGGERGQQIAEFRDMVDALHAAGLEVIVDVVYNHTAEGDHLGPTLAWKGAANADTYWMLDGGVYDNPTGCGNAIRAESPRMVELILSSLRYWVTDLHVDGFRFDLATTLARTSHLVTTWAPVLSAMTADPVLSQTKLIAEPWDIGIGGYQAGNFPGPWAEWNDVFRGTVRDTWRSISSLSELGARLTGSADRFAHNGRRPYHSINFITAHDGFTLADLVSYNDKHNEANGEDNRDGSDDNRSWNGGVEGPTDEPDVLKNRRARQRSLLATLMLSAGTPMMLSGDEAGRTQQGNNNVYCQDNELSWTHWDAQDADLIEWTKLLLRIRARYEVLRPERHPSPDDLHWFNEDGTVLTSEQWNDPDVRVVQAMFKGEPSVLLCLNTGPEPVEMTFPVAARVVLASEDVTLAGVDPSAGVKVPCYSIVVAEVLPEE
jgi:glycogen operon protein